MDMTGPVISAFNALDRTYDTRLDRMTESAPNHNRTGQDSISNSVEQRSTRCCPKSGSTSIDEADILRSRLGVSGT